MADQNIIELSDLTLTVSRDGQTAEYPILSAALEYSVGSFPVVSVLVSTAGEFLTGTTSRSAVKDILIDSPAGAVGAINLSLTIDGSSQSCILFCGYVATITPAFQTNIVSVSSTLSVQLICATGAVNGLPGNALRYYNLGGKDGGSAQPITYAELLKTMLPSVDADAYKLGKLFQQSPARCAAQLLDMLRGSVEREGTVTNISNTLIFNEGELGVKIPQPSSIPRTFLEQMSRALPSAPVAAVLNAALKQLYLTMIPETLGADEKTPCRMVVQAINAWDIEPHFELSVNDVIGIQEHTAYRLDQHIDFWVVQLPPIDNSAHPGRLSVYGPGVAEGSGKAHTYTEKEFQTVLEQQNSKKLLSNYSARMVMLPGWLNVLERTTATVDAAVRKNLPKNMTLLPVGDKETTTLIDVAERVAITGYLQEGCAAVASGIKLPFATYWKLLPHLGTMGSFEVPDAYTKQKLDADRLPTSKRYGLLSGLSLHITVERKELHVACGARFTNVHNEELQRQYASKHPLYPQNGTPQRS